MQFSGDISSYPNFSGPDTFDNPILPVVPLNYPGQSHALIAFPLPAIPISDAEKSSHVAIVITARGGHIGFLEGWWPSSKEQYMGRLFSQYFSAVLHDEGGEFTRTAEAMTQMGDSPTTPVN